MSQPDASPTAAIQAFWTWFQANEPVIQRAYDDGDTATLDALLSPKVEEVVPGAGWEMGPYALPSNALVFSPGVREKVAVCRDLVRAAPEIAGWTFFAAKPPKELTSLVVHVDGHEVCADRWSYRMTSYGGGEFVDLEIFFEDADSPEPANVELAAELLIEALVGEMISLERIGAIDTLCVPDTSAVERATPLRFLKNHLDQVLAPLQ
ncbi:MAG TPA: hypothetical protein VFH35_02010 [Ramlibacter sp.]|nr:hypothetical protein [Ramlibacter sp.]